MTEEEDIASDRNDDARVDASIRRREPTELQTRLDLSAWSIAISVGASVLSAALAVVLCLSVSSRNAQRGAAVGEELRRSQCAIIIAMDETYRDAPPTTETGIRQAQNMSQLRMTLGCPPYDGN